MYICPAIQVLPIMTTALMVVSDTNVASNVLLPDGLGDATEGM